MTDDEAQLIKRAQQRDTEAFCRLAEQYARRIYLLAYHYSQNLEDAEDISQEAWLKAYQALPTFRADSSFYTWLRRITINCFLNRHRSKFIRFRGRKTKADFVTIDCKDAEQTVEPSSASEEGIYNKLLFDRVVKALTTLTPAQRLMFLLRHYEGMSYEEIASAMNCSPGTVKKGVSRAIAKLRQNLALSESKPESLIELGAERSVNA